MEPASIRYKNPGAMWGNGLAVKWGADRTPVVLNDGKGQGNNIAVFPTFVQGICAQLDLWRTSKNYRNKRFSDAIAIWSGHNEVESYIRFVLARVPGMTRDTVMDDAFWMSPSGVAFLKAQAWHEAGKPYPAPDADWIEAQRRVFGGEVDEPAPEPAPTPVNPPPEDSLPIPPIYPSPYPRPPAPPAPLPPPVAPTLPWWKRLWAKAVATVSGIFGGGFYFGGFKITPELILSLTLAASVAGIGIALYCIGKKKEWWP